MSNTTAAGRSAEHDVPLAQAVIDEQVHQLAEEASRLIDRYWAEVDRRYDEEKARRTRDDEEALRGRLAVRARVLGKSLQIEWLVMRPKFVLGLTKKAPARKVAKARAGGKRITVSKPAGFQGKSKAELPVLLDALPKGAGYRYNPRTLGKYCRDWDRDLVMDMENKFAELRKQAKRLGTARRYLSEFEKARPLVAQELRRGE